MSAATIGKWLARPLKAIAVAEVTELHASVGTTIGEVRPENQDRGVVVRFTNAQRSQDSFVCAAICDGMGGMVDGARCAEIALSTFVLRLTQRLNETTSELIRLAALAANAEVYRQYRERGGTTLAALVAFPGSAAAVSVGDTRIYRFKDKKSVEQVSVDDTIAGELNKVRGLENSRSRWDPFADQLAQFIGIGEGIEPRLYPVDTKLRYLLTSDGAHKVSADAFGHIASFAGSPQQMVSRLLQFSRWCGGVDNATAICLSPLEPDWVTAPAWSSGGWLEIWDTAGKLELPIERFPAQSARQSDSPIRRDFPEPKSKRSRKRAPGASKKAAPTAGPTVSSPSAMQGSLKIEIVDEKPHNTESDVNRDSASTENTSGETKAGR